MQRLRVMHQHLEEQQLLAACSDRFYSALPSIVLLLGCLGIRLV